MKINEFLRTIVNLEFPKQEYCIIHSGAMFLYGLHDEVDCINLAISYNLYKKLVVQGRIDERKFDDNGFYSLKDGIKVCVVEKFSFIDTMSFQVENLRTTLANKKERILEKEDIKLLEGYLRLNPDYPEE